MTPHYQKYDGRVSVCFQIKQLMYRLAKRTYTIVLSMKKAPVIFFLRTSIDGLSTTKKRTREATVSHLLLCMFQLGTTSFVNRKKCIILGSTKPNHERANKACSRPPCRGDFPSSSVPRLVSVHTPLLSGRRLTQAVGLPSTSSLMLSTRYYTQKTVVTS
jgi:hypothetical protein